MKKIYQLIFGMLAAVLIAACADDKDFAKDFSDPQQTQGGTLVTIDASMPSGNPTSKVGISQQDNSLTMLPKWHADDEIQVFANQDDKTYLIGKTPVKNISEDGKSCSFSFLLPSEIDPEKRYIVFGFCGVDGVLDGNVVTIDSPMMRVPVSELRVPLYFCSTTNTTETKVYFIDLGAYEILHIANQSGSAITFAHNGYTSDTQWYHNAFHNIYDLNGSSSGVMQFVGGDGEPEIKATTVASGETASIVSWYTPNGKTISNATLNATINGYAVHSSNTKSSNTVIRYGRAYHLYAIWNGNELKFSNQDMIEDAVQQLSYTYAELPNAIKGLKNNGKYSIEVTGTYVDNMDFRNALNNRNDDNIELYLDFTSVGGMTKVPQRFCWDGRQIVYGVKLPADVKEIGQDAFTNCKNLISFELPSSVEKIGMIAFTGCGLESDLVLPSTLTEIGQGAFLNAFVGNAKPVFSNVSEDGINQDGKMWYAKDANTDEEIEYDQWKNTEWWNVQSYSFFTKKSTVIPYDPIVGDGFVDLGLPSGTLWATCNVGAENPWDYGDYFAWGETKPHEDDYYSWDNYTYNDNPTILDASHDAAKVNMGSDWRMPTQEEFQELLDYCEIEWTSNYNGTGVAGRIVWDTYSHSTHIFLPASGFRYNGDLRFVGSDGWYWSSSVNGWPCAGGCIFSERSLHVEGNDRHYGWTVRAVRCSRPAFNVQLLVSVDGQPIKEVAFGELVVFSVKSSVPADIRVYIDNKEIEVFTSNISADTYVNIYSTDDLHGGTHTFKIVASDSNGNTVEREKQLNIVGYYVDLGLPSGTLWAACNVGAENPWDYGDYFAWGEVTTKDYYDIYDYTYNDNPTTLDALHDAATVNMGSNWRMPTKEELQELLDYCEIEWTSNYNGTGVAGRIVWDTYSHSTHIFFPASGYCYCDGLGHFGLYYAGSNGYYWSSSVDASNYAWEFDFSSGNVTLDGNYRHYGRTVRAVRCR